MSNQQSLIVANENSNSSSSGYAFSSTMSSRSVTDSISMKEKSINDYPSTTCSHSSQGSVLWATNFQMAWSFTSSLSGPFWPSATSSFKCLNLPRVKSISGLDNLKLSSKGKMGTTTIHRKIKPPKDGMTARAKCLEWIENSNFLLRPNDDFKFTAKFNYHPTFSRCGYKFVDVDDRGGFKRILKVAPKSVKQKMHVRYVGN